MRRGEVLIGGPSLCSGYLVDPDDPDPDVVAKNRDEFVTINGIRYFCTGDIGQITPQGTLQIIDRKKDLVKLQQGEYVALSKVESALKASKYTAMPMVYADPAMSYCIALVCPNEPVLTKLAAELGVDGTLSELCADAKVIEAVLGDLQAACKAAKLQRFETPAKLVLIDEPWTPENDLLTAVQKLKRSVGQSCRIACHLSGDLLKTSCLSMSTVRPCSVCVSLAAFAGSSQALECLVAPPRM